MQQKEYVNMENLDCSPLKTSTIFTLLALFGVFLVGNGTASIYGDAVGTIVAGCLILLIAGIRGMLYYLDGGNK